MNTYTYITTATYNVHMQLVTGAYTCIHVPFFAIGLDGLNCFGVEILDGSKLSIKSGSSSIKPK